MTWPPGLRSMTLSASATTMVPPVKEGGATDDGGVDGVVVGGGVGLLLAAVARVGETGGSEAGSSAALGAESGGLGAGIENFSDGVETATESAGECDDRLSVSGAVKETVDGSVSSSVDVNDKKRKEAKAVNAAGVDELLLGGADVGDALVAAGVARVEHAELGAGDEVAQSHSIPIRLPLHLTGGVRVPAVEDASVRCSSVLLAGSAALPSTRRIHGTPGDVVAVVRVQHSSIRHLRARPGRLFHQLRQQHTQTHTQQLHLVSCMPDSSGDLLS